MKHKTPWNVWLWLALGVALVLMSIALAIAGLWHRALTDLTLGALDLIIASQTYRISRLEHENRLLFAALKPFASKGRAA